MNMEQIRADLTANFHHKKILIWGYGREGKSSHKFLTDLGANVEITVADSRENSDNIPVPWIVTSGWTEQFRHFDCIFKSPGISTLGMEIDSGKITSQTEVFLRYHRRQTIGITGTKGKSTTSSLLYHVLKAYNDDVFLVGNIGVPCLDFFYKVTKDSTVVFEMSAHQLEIIEYSPHISVFTNFFEEHLDFYGTLERYLSAKKNIFLHQSPDDVLIVNSDVAVGREPKGKIYTISALENQSPDILINPLGRTITCLGEVTTITENDTLLLGGHNLYNIGICLFISLKLKGLSTADFLEELKTFHGLPHRLEYAGIFHGVAYYNDSISTTVESVIQAVHSIKNCSTLLVGGMDRGIDYSSLVEFIENRPTLSVILMYKSGKRIYDCLKKRDNIFYVGTLKEGVSLGKKVTPPGTACILSPGAASYDSFINFEDRGNQFKAMIALD